MIPTNVNIDTNIFFAGGGGFFIQYADVIKPIGLYAIEKMLLTDQSYGLPLSILKEFTNHSLVEWYVRRGHINPLYSLDYEHYFDHADLDELYHRILASDPSIYTIAAPLNVTKLFGVYRAQHMNFPVFIYHPTKEPGIKADCDQLLRGIHYQLVSGDLESALPRGVQNFTYIFSDIEEVQKAVEHLHGTMSHVILANDYRYNEKGCTKQFRYDLLALAKKHPFVRIGSMPMVNRRELGNAIAKLYK